MATSVKWPALRSLVNIADTMYFTSKGLWEDKKSLAVYGMDGIVSQLGEGKDLMSILRECHKLIRSPFNALTWLI